jgi:hypothetical protein
METGRPAGQQPAHANRDAEIVRMRADGVPPRVIADRFGTSQVRVCQVWRKHCASDGAKR